MPGRWKRLVVTDAADAGGDAAQNESTLIVCLDYEAAERLRGTGCVVRMLSEYQVETLANYCQLYERYSITPTCSDAVDDGCADADLQVALYHLRYKAVEAWAPVMYVWELIESVLRCEEAAAVETRIDDPWLRVVIEARLKQLENLLK